MKTLYFLFLIILTLLLFRISVSYGYDWVCIDPGHGGPGASQYGSNGDGAGTYGLVYHLSEQWVSLKVASAQKDFVRIGCKILEND